MSIDHAERAIHTSGAVSLAIMQYLRATDDTDILTVGHMQEVLAGIANFYTSRLIHNATLDKHTILSKF